MVIGLCDKNCVNDLGCSKSAWALLRKVQGVPLDKLACLRGPLCLSWKTRPPDVVELPKPKQQTIALNIQQYSHNLCLPASPSYSAPTEPVINRRKALHSFASTREKWLSRRRKAEKEALQGGSAWLYTENCATCTKTAMQLWHFLTNFTKMKKIWKLIKKYLKNIAFYSTIFLLWVDSEEAWGCHTALSCGFSVEQMSSYNTWRQVTVQN